MARKRAGRSSRYNTYEGRKTRPDMLVAQREADKGEILNVGWGKGRSVMTQHYQHVSSFAPWLHLVYKKQGTFKSSRSLQAKMSDTISVRQASLAKGRVQ